MNIENVNSAIAIMQRANDNQFDMEWIQRSPNSHGPFEACKTETAFHACGNTACFAGHVAISPEWESFKVGNEIIQGKIVAWGSPSVFGGDDPHTAIAFWLGISTQLIEDIIYGCTESNLPTFVQCEWRKWKPKHLIQILEAIKSGELK